MKFREVRHVRQPLCARFSALGGSFFSSESSWKPKQLGLRQWEGLIIMYLDYGTICGAAPQFVPYSNCFIISASHCRKPSWKAKRFVEATTGPLADAGTDFNQDFDYGTILICPIIKVLIIISASVCRRPSWKPKRTQTATTSLAVLVCFGFQLDSIKKVICLAWKTV